MSRQRIAIVGGSRPVSTSRASSGSSDPGAAGARWRFARSETPLGDAFLWDPDARLGVCGDWTCGGRIEGAFSSGEALATAMVGGRRAS